MQKKDCFEINVLDELTLSRYVGFIIIHEKCRMCIFHFCVYEKYLTFVQTKLYCQIILINLE